MTDKEIIYGCVDRYRMDGCKDLMVHTVSAVLAADLLSQNFERQTDLGSFLSEYMLAVSGDNLESGFSGHSAETCHKKYAYADTNSCSDEGSLAGMCKETGEFAHPVPIGKESRGAKCTYGDQYITVG